MNGTLLNSPSVIGTRLDRPVSTAYSQVRPPCCPLPPSASPRRCRRSRSRDRCVRPRRVRSSAPCCRSRTSRPIRSHAAHRRLPACEHRRVLVPRHQRRGGELRRTPQPSASPPTLRCSTLTSGSIATATSSLRARRFRASAGARPTGRAPTSSKATSPDRCGRRCCCVGVAILGAGLTFLRAPVASAGGPPRTTPARRHQRRAREEFISIVSHELRTPATGQLGFLQTPARPLDSMNDDDRRQTVSQAYANARRLHALSRDVLDTASIESGELPYAFQVIDLRPAVQTAVDAILSPNHELVVVSSEVDVSVRADAERIQQVLANMLDNAIKNSPVGSRIDVRVAISGEDALVGRERSWSRFDRGGTREVVREVQPGPACRRDRYGPRPVHLPKDHRRPRRSHLGGAS